MGVAGISVPIAFVLYVWKQRRNRMARKKIEEEMGGDVISTEPEKKKGKGFKLKFGKDKVEQPTGPVQPDEVIEFPKEDEKAPDELPSLPEDKPEPVEEPKTINLANELMLVAEHLARLAQAIAPPETPEQKKIRELEEQILSLKK